MSSVYYSWKAYLVDLREVNLQLRGLLSENYDGLICDIEGMCVVFFDTASDEDLQTLSNYWESILPPEGE